MPLNNFGRLLIAFTGYLHPAKITGSITPDPAVPNYI
jgi:hypothetical protein